MLVRSHETMANAYSDTCDDGREASCSLPRSESLVSQGLSIKEVFVDWRLLCRLYGSKGPQQWYGWPDTAVCTGVENPNVSLSELRPVGAELSSGCTVEGSLIVNAWVQARPCMRRLALLAAFAELDTSFDACRDGSRDTSHRSSLRVPVYSNSDPALSGKNTPRQCARRAAVVE